jgi:hypothetical protein
MVGQVLGKKFFSPDIHAFNPMVSMADKVPDIIESSTSEGSTNASDHE